ncbi:MAG: DinB family protein [Candidatus Binatia bacterium]
MGFNRDELAEALGLSFQKEEKIADRWLFDTLDRILEAVIRASQQVPADRFLWKTPDRDRSLKVFCYHILADPSHVMEAISTQKYDGSFKLTYAQASDRFNEMEGIACFGEETRARLHNWSQAITSQDLDRPIEGYSGRTNGHELLHHVLAHSAHHLRQLYDCLGRIGVTPTNPLAEENFSGIKMPKDLW